jgi:hypothetical protein
MGRLVGALCVGVMVLGGTALAGEAGYRRVNLPAQGMSLLLPTSWKTLSAAQAKKLLTGGTFVRDNPQFAGVMALMGKPDPPIKLFAFDPVPVDRFATNANVVILPSRPVPASAFRQALVREANAIGVIRLRAAQVRFPSGPAVRLTYGLRVKQGARTVTTATTQYAFQRPTRSVVVTYTTLPAAASTYAPIFTTSARSIRFTR